MAGKMSRKSAKVPKEAADDGDSTETPALKRPLASIRKSYATYSKEIALIGTFFVLTLTLANLLHRVVGIALLPFFQATFDSFHKWCHIVLHVLVYSWVTALAEWCWYGVSWVGSLALPIVAWRPHLVIPPVVSDISLVSAAFTRVFSSTDLIVPREQRALAEKAMTPDLWEEVDKLEGRFWGPIHRVLERVNAGIWQLIEHLQSIIPAGRFARVRTVARAVLIGFAGAVLLWGFIRLAGYIINLSMARRSQAPIMTIRRRFFKYFAMNFLGACFTVAVFFVLNAWLADLLAP